MGVQKEWIDILARLYKNLHLSKEVVHHSRIQDKKNQKILSYLNKLEEIHQKVSTRKGKGLEQLLKSFYHERYIIKEENIPEGYYLKEQRILRERGYGDVELTKERKHQLALQIIEDQKTNLNSWLDYFLYDEESKSYEIWEKYWVFQGIMTLGQYDKQTGKFHKRDQSTVYPFPPVEREAVFTTLNLMEEYLKTKASPEGLENALKNANFKTLYEYTLKEIQNRGGHKQNTTKGIWIKYDQGSDYHRLRDSLQGYYTGWCTAAGENFAKNQLENGDFYVYYTEDENKEYKIPRIAIRMEEYYNIGEIRGISENQNLEPEMLPILNKKLEEFPDRDKYYKKEHDMALLTKIEYKNKEKKKLTKEELRFLYEIDQSIDGFGYRKDPRIYEIKNSRNPKRDLAEIFNVSENDISLIEEEALSGEYKVYYGDLDLRDLITADGLVLPKVIYGDLNLSGLRSSEGLVLPEIIHGSLHLGKLISAEDLVLPKVIYGVLNLMELTSAEGLLLPKIIHGRVDLGSLTTEEVLVLSEVIHGDLDLRNLITAEGLVMPKEIYGTLHLESLISMKCLVLPRVIHGTLYLGSLTSVEVLVLPEEVHGDLDLGKLTSAEDLVLPNEIHGDLDLGGLTSAKGLVLPRVIHGDLYLNNLTSAEGLVLPNELHRNLWLGGLTRRIGLTVPYSFKDKIRCQSRVYEEITFVPDDEYYKDMEKPKVKELSLKH